MNTITSKCLTLLFATLACLGATLHAAQESVSQQAGALIAKQDLPRLMQMCEHALRPGANAERAEICKTIIAHVGREDVPPVIKGELLTLLGHFGRAESVEYLAGLLSHQDPLFRTRAVLGLQHNPSVEAAAALRKALAGAASAADRASMIHALSVRRDVASLAQFLKDAASADEAVRTAALLAVARLSDAPCNALFRAGMKQGPDTAKREATTAYLLHADRLAKLGKKPDVLAIYHELLAQGGHVKAAALLGMARTGGAAELTAILANINGADRVVVDVAGNIFEHIPRSGPVVAAVCESVKTADPTCKARLIEVLGRYADPAAVQTVLAAAKDPDQAVRTAAVTALGHFDDPRAANALVGALTAGKDTEAAMKVVTRNPQGPGMARALIAALPGAMGPARVSLVRAMRTCPASEVVPALVKTANDADSSVRAEVFDVLRRIGDPGAYPRLVERLAAEPDEQVRLAAVNTLASLGARVKEPSQRVSPVLERLAVPACPGRPSLLVVLARVSSQSTQEAGLKFVREALGAQDDKLRRAAIQALAEWPSPDVVLDDLLQAAKRGPGSVLGVLALRAYNRQIGVLIEKRAAATGEKPAFAEVVQKELVRRCADGLKVAVQPAEKSGFLSLLGRLPCPDALQAAAACQDDPSVKREAIQAVLSISAALHKTHPDTVKPVLVKIKAAEDKEWQPRVEQLLKAIEAKK